MADVLELLDGAEAKAYYGLAINWKPFEALVKVITILACSSQSKANRDHPWMMDQS
jgi:hypothetical protein